MFRWPAVVSPDPWSDGQSVVEEREGRIYHVEFLGKDHTHNWSVEDKVSNSSYCMGRKRRGND